MSFLKSLFIDLLFIIIYITFYYFLGFELIIIISLAQIISNLYKNQKPKSTLPPKQMYTQQTFPKKIKF